MTKRRNANALAARQRRAGPHGGSRRPDGGPELEVDNVLELEVFLKEYLKGKGVTVNLTVTGEDILTLTVGRNGFYAWSGMKFKHLDHPGLIKTLARTALELCDKLREGRFICSVTQRTCICDEGPCPHGRKGR